MGCDQQHTDSPATSNDPSTVTLDEVQSDAANAMDTTATYLQQSKAKLTKELKAQIEVMDANIEKLRRKGQDQASDAKENWDQKMTELDAKRQLVNEKLTEIENSTSQEWSNAETKAKAAWEDLKQAFNNAANEL
jgi:hypothetical protein